MCRLYASTSPLWIRYLSILRWILVWRSCNQSKPSPPSPPNPRPGSRWFTQATEHEPGFVLRQSGSRTFSPSSKPVYLISSTLRPASSACKAGADSLQPGYLHSKLPPGHGVHHIPLNLPLHCAQTWSQPWRAEGLCGPWRCSVVLVAEQGEPHVGHASLPAQTKGRGLRSELCMGFARGGGRSLQATASPAWWPWPPRPVTRSRRWEHFALALACRAAPARVRHRLSNSPRQPRARRGWGVSSPWPSPPGSPGPGLAPWPLPLFLLLAPLLVVGLHLLGELLFLCKMAPRVASLIRELGCWGRGRAAESGSCSCNPGLYPGPVECSGSHSLRPRCPSPHGKCGRLLEAASSS